MRDRVGIACATGLLLAIACGSCGPGLEPPLEGVSERRPRGEDSAGEQNGDSGPPKDDEGLDAGVETDHTNVDDPGN